ncbi:MAG: hypothetical protein NTV86_03660 [Planctomycetota bacterium]|nr:hypothetical protein [Planctomycetota bacterium]
MGILSEQQKQRAIEVMREYLAAPKNPDGNDTPLERQTARDMERGNLIDARLKPLVLDYLAGKVPLDEFKSTVDSLNKQHEYWGFKGIKGQMFFNMVFNRAGDPAELDVELKAAIVMPVNEDMAGSRIRTFAGYVKRLGEQHLEMGGGKHGRPKVSSVPFFLSYFWQIQGRETWPVYYTNSVNTMVDLNIWTPTEDPATDYVTYKHLYEELAGLFTQASGRRFGIYEVEHVFWFKGGNPWGDNKPVRREDSQENQTPSDSRGTQTVSRLPESYVPPIVASLADMALNDPALAEAAKASGTSLERAFEKSINAAFTILGYDAKLLGQGAGRVPDGQVVEADHSYAVLWDAKIRSKGYSMGTDDRTIREYIVTQSRELHRRRSLRNIYYLIISSGFADDWDDAVRSLKMETDVSDVCLMEAAALVALVDAKLRDPHQLTLGPDGIQRLFSTSGVITADDVQEMLG